MEEERVSSLEHGLSQWLHLNGDVVSWNDMRFQRFKATNRWLFARGTPVDPRFLTTYLEGQSTSKQSDGPCIIDDG